MVDVTEMGKYLANVMDNKEIDRKGFRNYLPERYNEGTSNIKNKPGIAFLDSDRMKINGFEIEKWNWEGKLAIEGEIKKEMTSIMIGKMVEIVMENHLYSAGGLLYKQRKGGPIGLKLTTVLAECLMLVFDNKYGRVLDEVGLEPVLNKRYVDDSNLVGEGVQEGTRVVRNEEGKLTLDVGNEEVNEGESSTARTARVYRELANKIMPDSVEMEEGIGENQFQTPYP